MKLCLGSAQFGLNYGLTNKTGKVNSLELRNILDISKKNGIKTIDTAFSYGDSEKALGTCGIKGFKLISKLPSLPDTKYTYLKLKYFISNSLGRLQLPKLHGILFHNSADLLNQDAQYMNECFERLKEERIVSNFGVSIYNTEELDKLFEKNFDINIVQGPINIFDRRIVTSGWLNELAKKNVEFHARSIFLQGLLIEPVFHAKPYFRNWKNVFERYENFVCESGYDSLSLALNYVKSISNISNIIVGIQSTSQIKEIISKYGKVIDIDYPSYLASNDEMLVNPSFWRI